MILDTVHRATRWIATDGVMNNKLDILGIKGKAWRGQIPPTMKAQMTSEQLAEIQQHLKEKVQFWVQKVNKYATDEMRS